MVTREAHPPLAEKAAVLEAEACLQCGGPCTPAPCVGACPAGIDVPDSVDGRSLRPVLTGEREQIYDAVYAHFRDSQRMIRTAEWKYAVYPQAGREQLFHVAEDPDELQNLVNGAAHAEVLSDLRVRLTTWRQERGDVTLGP